MLLKSIMIGIVILVWFEVLFFYVLTKRLREKLALVKTMEEISQFVFKTALGKISNDVLLDKYNKINEGSKLIKKILRVTIVAFVIVTAYLLISIGIKVAFLLFAENKYESNLGSQQFVDSLSSEVVILAWLIVFGCYLFLGQLRIYADLLIRKYEELFVKLQNS